MFRRLLRWFNLPLLLPPTNRRREGANLHLALMYGRTRNPREGLADFSGDDNPDYRALKIGFKGRGS